MYKLFITALWPVYYHVPIYKELSKMDDINVEVLYFDNIGLRPIKEKEFGNVERKWDEFDLLSGYKFRFIKNSIKHNNDKGFFNLVNPGIIKILYKEKPDVIMIQGYATLSDWLSFFTAKFLKIPIIFRGEATLRRNEGKTFKSKLKEKFLRWWLKGCDVVMYSCTGNKEYWKYYGVSENKMLPIPCAVDNDFFQNERKKYVGREKEIKEKLGIDKNDFVIIYVSRMNKNKNIESLIKAVSKIDNKNIILLLVGDGPERNNLEKLVKKYNLKSVFVGFKNISEISKYYAIANLFVLLSKDFENSPKVLNEAMNFELPVIITDIAGTAEDLVFDNINGFKVNPLDIEDIAQKIDYLNKNRSLAKKMGKKSLEIVNAWTFEKGAYYINEAIKRIMSNEGK